MNKQLITLKEFLELKSKLVDNIKSSNKKYDYLIGNLRGGFYLCDALSRNLEVPYYLTRISLRDSKNFKDFNLLPVEFESDKNYLFVDDLIDSGESISELKLKQNIDFCVLLKNPRVDTVNKCYYGKVLESEIWIDFFWEVY